jgi:uncharacterized small protein (DUF1192 family)
MLRLLGEMKMVNLSVDTTQKFMRQTDVVDLIVRAGRTTSHEKLNVKQRIQAARKDGYLPQTYKLKGRIWLNTKEVFQWAAQQKGWENLRSVQGISSSVSIQVEGVSATSVAGDIFSSTLEARVAVLEEKLRKCTAELEAYKNRSKKAQEAGRKGGLKKKFFD